MQRSVRHAAIEYAGTRKVSKSTAGIVVGTRGAHVIAEYHGCDPERLNHEKTIRRMLQRAAEAAGSTALDVLVRPYAPQGLAGVAVLAESHLSVHTWPDACYAAADFYTCGRAEPRRAHDVMRRELLAGRAELIEIVRGLPGGTRSLSILSTEQESYGRRATIRIDARDGGRHGVRIGRTDDGASLRLEATRAFTIGERVFPLESLLYSADAEFVLETDWGPVPLGIDWDWLDLSPKWFERLPEPLSARLCALYQIPAANWPQLFLAMTSEGTRTRMVASFGEVARHSSDPNTAPAIAGLTLEAGGVLCLPFVATRPIAAGDELVWDYSSVDPTLFAAPTS